jgi:hypothetical protein
VIPNDRAAEALNYRTRADANMPQTVDDQRRTAKDLAREGYGDYTIADPLRMDVAAVRRLIGQCGDCQ